MWFLYSGHKGQLSIIAAVEMKTSQRISHFRPRSSPCEAKSHLKPTQRKPVLNAYSYHLVWMSFNLKEHYEHAESPPNNESQNTQR